MTDFHDPPEQGFGPADHSVTEVLEHVEEHPEQVEAVVAAPPPEKPSTSKKAQRKQRTGLYLLQAGDTPATVARMAYGRGSFGRDIVIANPGVKWREGVEIKIPDVN